MLNKPRWQWVDFPHPCSFLSSSSSRWVYLCLSTPLWCVLTSLSLFEELAHQLSFLNWLGGARRCARVVTSEHCTEPLLLSTSEQQISPQHIVREHPCEHAGYEILSQVTYSNRPGQTVKAVRQYGPVVLDRPL